MSAERVFAHASLPNSCCSACGSLLPLSCSLVYSTQSPAMHAEVFSLPSPLHAKGRPSAQTSMFKG
eukprot:3280364-Pleurochrysis_carterae.AAC.1